MTWQICKYQIKRHGVFWSLVGVTTVILIVYTFLFCRSMADQGWSLHQLRILLYLWQTQAAAVLAVLAAGIGATVVLRQTNDAREIADEQRSRRAQAQRALLPIALNGLADYAREIAEIFARRIAGVLPSGAIAFPVMPQETLKALQDFIESGDPEHARPLMILASRLQIFRARINQFQRSLADQSNIISAWSNLQRLVDAAEIYARCGNGIEYGRRRDAKPADAITADDVLTAVRLMLVPTLIPVDINSQIDQIAERSKENGNSWPEN